MGKVGQGHICTATGKGKRHPSADAKVAAGYQGCFSFQINLHAYLLFLWGTRS
jgi:hypothetical protein